MNKEIISVKKVKSLENYKEIGKRIAVQISNEVTLKGFLHFKYILNKETEVFAIETDFDVENGTNGTFNDIFSFECQNSRGILVNATSNYTELELKTDFVIANVEDIQEESGFFKVNDIILIEVKGEERKGKIFRSGRINNIFCYAVELNQLNSLDESIFTCIVIENDVLKLLNENGIQDKYVFPPYSILLGDGKGIQGNLNSCYLDTSIFSIFTFNIFLDNMLLDENGEENIRELRDILKTEIVYPLRKTGYVSYVDVTKFRDKLQSLSPAGKFVINERDPEEFLEQLFKLLTPNKYLLRTKPFRDMGNEQKCFLTQLFYDAEETKEITLQDLFTMTFLEFEMFISKPPKCLILQLPRDGRDLKKFKKIFIPPKLDITSFIIASAKTCKDCTTTGSNLFFCQKCSKSNNVMVYYCKVHSVNCKHETVVMPDNDESYRGPVVLDLVSILCIERTHYISFVKTNHVNGEWIYFNSMEKYENSRFIPHVRGTNLNEYFNNNNKLDVEYDQDVDKIEKYAFICVYKYSDMEFYNTDFNSEGFIM